MSSTVAVDPSREQTLGPSGELTLPGEGSDSTAGTVALAPGDRVGRYEILSHLGAGAMGTVFAAHDPKLHRTLAIKLVHPGRSVSPEATLGDSEERLLQEARALARVHAPNVVAVHDTGTHGEHVFIAMEFIDGETLEQWQAREDPDWRSVVGVYVQAARGLAAAHAADIVHRDFKPANVMLAAAGRVVVTDFGLAVPSFAPAGQEEVTVRESPQERASRLTRTGAIVGTPAYMSLEQFSGEPVGPASDQFAFCLALYESLYGVPAFPLDSVEVRVGALISGEPREPPTDRSVPAGISALLRQGLDPEPERRHRDMGALADALETSLRPRRRRPAIVVGALGFATVAGVLLGRDPASTTSTDAQCPSAQTWLEGTWDAATRERIGGIWATSSLPAASAVWPTVAGRIDDYAAALGRAQHEACVARGPDLDTARACFEEQRNALRTTAELLASPDAQLIEHAHALVPEHAGLQVCLDSQRLATWAAGTHENSDELKGQLDRAHALYAAGQYEATRDETLAMVAPSELSGAVGLRIQGELLHAWATMKLGDPHAAAVAFEGLHADATRERLDEATADAIRGLLTARAAAGELDASLSAWFQLADAALDRIGAPPIKRAEMDLAVAKVLEGLGRIDEARERALGALERLEGEGVRPERRASALVTLAVIETIAGRYDEALARAQDAKALLRAQLGDAHPAVARIEGHLASIAFKRGDAQEGIGHQQRELEVLERAFGADHPSTAHKRVSLASIYGSVGQYDLAAAQLDRAMPVLEAGPNPLDHAFGLATVGRLALVQGRLDEAGDALRAALKIRTERLGPAHPTVSSTLVALAALAQTRGDFPRALDYAEQMLSIAETRYGASHLEVADPLHTMGTVLAQLDRDQDAYDSYRRELEIYESHLGDHPYKATCLLGLAESELEVHHDDAALRHARRGRAMGVAVGLDPLEQTMADVIYARARWRTGDAGAKRDALAMISAARQTLVEAGPFAAPAVAAVDAWLEHPE